ncbi:MAG: hypothetical protein RLZZ553_123 [Verrucomicrobiota bacterium]
MLYQLNYRRVEKLQDVELNRRHLGFYTQVPPDGLNLTE